MHDVLTNLSNLTVNCLDKGFVTLVDSMPRLVPSTVKTADYAIPQAARTSFGDDVKKPTEDRTLIRHLMRHTHTSPLEMVEFKFHCQMPIFVARQWVRHRMASLNEVSGRYSVLKDDFYIPDVASVRRQSMSNKQGGDEPMAPLQAQEFLDYLEKLTEETYARYTAALEDGVSREQARMILPVNLYTRWYWKTDLHNLLHFLALRCDKHAQEEIRVFGDAILSLITPIVPVTVEAWNDYHPMRGAVRLTRLEFEALRKSLTDMLQYVPVEKQVALNIESDNKREQAEWFAKVEKLGLKI